MDKATVNMVIDFLKSELSAIGINIGGIALFGSQLSETASPDSDIDLILISEDFKDKNIFERSELTMAAELKVMHKFHLPTDIIKMTYDEFQQGIMNKRYHAMLM
jgi:predicted nucleotidyltransferase